MRGNRQTQIGNYLKSGTTAAILAFSCQLLMLPFDAQASENATENKSGEPTDAKLQRAFELGLGQEITEAGEYQLVVQRFGPTFVFSTESGDEKTLELTCVLCSQTEALQKAHSFGREFVTTNGAIDPDVSASGEPTAEPLELVAFDTRTTSKRLRPAVLLVGLGLSAVALGCVFIWLDGHCATPACAQDHATKRMGIAFLGAGAVLDVGALVWLFWPEKADGGST